MSQKLWAPAGADQMASTVLPRRFFINGTSIFGGEAIARLATALMALVVARFYGLEALGNYGYTLALASVLLIVPDLGLHLFIVREIASSSPERIPEVFWNVHGLKLGLAATVTAFALSFGQLAIADRERRLLFYVLIIRILLQSFSQAAIAVFKALEQMHYVALQQSVNSVVVIAWTGLSLWVGARLPVVVAGLVVGQVAETLVGWTILRKAVPFLQFKLWNRQEMARIAAASFPFGITAILLALNLRIDVLVLSRYASSRILGQFNSAAWFMIAMFLGASLLMSVLFPRLSRILEQPSGLGSEYVRSLLKNALMFTAITSIIVWIFAPLVIRVAFGPEFSPATHLLRILAPALPLVVLNTIFFYIFAAARRRFVCLVTLGFGLVLGTVLSVYLTSLYGATGSASADVVREFVMSSIYLCFLIQGNHARSAGVALLKVFASATGLLAVAVIVGSAFQIRLLSLAVWTIFVLMGAIATLGFPKIEEWRLLTDDRL
jgi:O-antigen/teichoic acid export membrane protein